MASIDFWQLLGHHALVFLVGYNPYVRRRAYCCEPIERELQQRTPRAKHVDKLLWLLFGAHWPEPTANSTCHDDEMIKIVRAHKIVIFISLQGLAAGKKQAILCFVLRHSLVDERLLCLRIPLYIVLIVNCLKQGITLSALLFTVLNLVKAM